MSEPYTRRIGACVVLLDPAREVLYTIFPDGAVCPAAPNPPDTDWQATVTHELGHSWLATEDWPGASSGTASPTLYRVARERAGLHSETTDDTVAREEARVLAWQATLGDGPRPWDEA